MAFQPSYSVPLEQGAPRAINPADPAAGANYLMPDSDLLNVRFNVLRVTFDFVTAAGGGDRQMRLIFPNGTPFGHEFIVQATQAAALTRVYHLDPVNPQTPVTVGTDIIAPLPSDIPLNLPFFKLQIVPIGIQAGDQLQNIAIMGRAWAQRTA